MRYAHLISHGFGVKTSEFALLHIAARTDQAIECAKCTFKLPVSETNDPLEKATLAAALAILEPLAGMLLSRQLRFAQAEELFKSAFVQASARASAAQGKVPTVSTLSVATGIRRREVKRLLEQAPLEVPRKASAASQARLRWATDPVYLDPQGQPLRLPRVAEPGEPSFATLAAAVSKDTHPRALLDELIRVGAVQLDDEHVVLTQKFFTPSKEHEELMEIAGHNVGDHLSAVLVNLLSEEPPFLERAIFADGLSKLSAQQGADLAKEVWVTVSAVLRKKLQALVDRDEGEAQNQWRMRIGLYSYIAPEERPAAPVRASARGGPKKQSVDGAKDARSQTPRRSSRSR